MIEIKILDKYIGLKHPTYFIADIAANHDGDLGRAKALIHRAKACGADAAKFQNFRAETIVSGRRSVKNWVRRGRATMGCLKVGGRSLVLGMGMGQLPKV